MATFTITFPDDALAGIVESYCQNRQPFVENPEWSPENQSVPTQIDNPVSKVDHAKMEILGVIALNWEHYSIRQQRVVIEQQLKDAVNARKVEVVAGTTVEVVEVTEPTPA